MIKGLELFQQRFKEFNNQYVLIGGSACWVVMNRSGLSFRRTNDLDIVLVVETLSQDFRIASQQFLKDGQYSMKSKSSGNPSFFRFNKPANPDYPYQIEFLSWDERSIEESNPGDIISMTIEEEMTSLAAILMNPEMYAFVKRNIIKIDGLPIVDETCLIPLKIRAWVDLTARKLRGEKIKEDEIRKHKSDVYLLQQLLIPRPLAEVPTLVRSDVATFIEYCLDDEQVLVQTGILDTTMDEIREILKLVYLR